MHQSSHFNSLTFSIILILLVSSCSRPSEDAGANTFKYVEKNFAAPDKQFGSAPLWVWHTQVTKPIIDSMMLEFSKNAFGGVFVHARPGLITEYLSDDWYDLFQYTVKKGKELGLDVWIYDENSYPSGFAGGLVPEQMPESYKQGEMLHMKAVDNLPANMEGVFIGLKEENGKYVDVTSSIGSYRGKRGKYFLFTKEFYGPARYMINGPVTSPYVDLMVKGVTEKFIDITMPGYEKVAGAEFGKAVPGIFSDEPSIPIAGEGNVRWTPELFDRFKQKWGYDLQVNLPSLFEEVGDWQKVRHNHQEILSQLFIDRWSKPMHAYTEKNHLKWTGHYWEHGWPSPGDVPDNMAMYAWHQQPGIDMLFNQFNEISPNAQFGNIRSVKELTSVANQLDKERTLSETYGGGGWELTFKDMKRLGDWEFVLGVNFLNQHLSMMTLTGARKYDYPQSFSYHTPWWPYYKSLNQYFSRLSLALSRGEQKNDIIILEPTTSAWMYSIPGNQDKRMIGIGKLFQEFVTTLEKAQVEYDLGCENIIMDHGKVEQGKFVVGSRAYTTVVIPPGMENIDGPTFKLLKEYADQGGKVIQVGKLQRLDGAASDELSYLSVPQKNIIHLGSLDKSIIAQYFQKSDFRIDGLNPDDAGGDLYHHRRILKDGQLVFLSNASMNAPSKGHMSAKGKDALLLDLFTGEIRDYPEQEKDGAVSVAFEIPPAGSVLFFISDNKMDGFKPYEVPGDEKVVNTGPVQVLRPDENTLMIDFCDVNFIDSKKQLKDIHTWAASNTVFRHYGFEGGEGDPWNNQTQFKKQIVERDTFPAGTGFTATYHFNIDKQVDYKAFRAVVEQGKLWKKIEVNNKPVEVIPGQWWLDRSFGVLEIGSLLQPGENTLSVSCVPMSVFAEIEPVYILGNFNLESAAKGWRVVAPQPLQLGSWKKQGLSLYGQRISYVKECNLENIDREFAVHLGAWKGTVAAVRVNGIPAGIITSEPNSLTITKFLKKGANRVEVVIVGSLKNLLGPHHNSPEPGLVGPNYWKDITSHPAGSKYDTYEYGMMEDFQLVSFANQSPPGQ